MQEPLLKIKDAAEILGISAKQLRKLIDNGRLPVVSLGDSARGDRIDSADLTDFIQNSKRRNQSCQSINAVMSGGANLKLISNELEKALGKPAKGRLKNLNAS